MPYYFSYFLQFCYHVNKLYQMKPKFQEVRVVQISPIYFVNQVVVICNNL